MGQIRPNTFTEKAIYLQWIKGTQKILISDLRGTKIREARSEFKKDCYSPGHIVNCECVDPKSHRTQPTPDELKPIIYPLHEQEDNPDFMSYIESKYIKIGTIKKIRRKSKDEKPLQKHQYYVDLET